MMTDETMVRLALAALVMSFLVRWWFAARRGGSAASRAPVSRPAPRIGQARGARLVAPLRTAASAHGRAGELWHTPTTPRLARVPIKTAARLAVRQVRRRAFATM
ncbi:hypothetical protein ACFQY4_22500 [Catellatospora bangladeshensis]|uniref:Uncharacterized protein n=1 Tax=Catellatospora bangladeshensis TaxID=310355 RepID=A0A8J3NJG5_9ACTN|nr:hypothetical protein [Catellatospora bangladeshensis]GIF80420.1 hypothetical protein Cba03nite_17690 [Catellatospora bangladeshensis]